MSNPIVDLDTAAAIDLSVMAGYGFTFTFTHTDNGTPVPLTGVWVMTIWDENVSVTYPEGGGLTKASNVLTISKNDAGNALAAGRYLYRIKKTEAGTSTPIYKGQFIAKSDKEVEV